LRVLYFDCFSGAAGDMILGALIDAGVALDDVQRALGSLAVAPDTVWTERVVRAGITGTKFRVRGEDPDPPDRAHDHGHGAAGHAHDAGTSGHEERSHHLGIHRTLAEIGRLVDGSALSVEGKARAHDLFRRLAEVEARVHGVSVDDVHLHEVGAVDSIVDIVGTVFALDVLRPDRIVSSPLNVGSGTLRSAHGLYPVPAPATMKLLEGAPIYSGPQRAELVTPTGALLITSYASAFGPIPPMRIGRVGYGAGARDFPGMPNVLRVLVGEADATAPAHSVIVIEAEIDDMNPQIFGLLMDRLLELGALDVFYTAIQMKKSRPGTLLSVIAPPEARQRLTAAIFRETTTIGVRYREMQRECLDREVRNIETPLGVVRFKIARRGDDVLNASPEFDDCVRLATEHGRPVKEIQAMAIKAFYDA
jgi:uncharacterized protein (TIGR00299 family) protein